MRPSLEQDGSLPGGEIGGGAQVIRTARVAGREAALAAHAGRLRRPVTGAALLGDRLRLAHELERDVLISPPQTMLGDLGQKARHPEVGAYHPPQGQRLVDRLEVGAAAGPEGRDRPLKLPVEAEEDEAVAL